MEHIWLPQLASCNHANVVKDLALSTIISKGGCVDLWSHPWRLSQTHRKLNAIKGPTVEYLGLDSIGLVECFNNESRKFNVVIKQDTNVEVMKTENQSNTDWINDFIKPRKTIPVEHKVKENLNSPQEEEDCDFLFFWMTHQHHWPIIACMARAMLAVPATSAWDERFFLSSSHVMSESCSYFTALNREAQVWIKMWDKLLKKCATCIHLYGRITDYHLEPKIHDSNLDIWESEDLWGFPLWINCFFNNPAENKKGEQGPPFLTLRSQKQPFGLVRDGLCLGESPS